MNYILFDDASRTDLLPLTYTRPIADLRVGILTIREKWEKMLNAETSTLTEDYLSTKWPVKRGENSLLINGSILPNAELIEAISKLQPLQALVYEETVIAYYIDTLEQETLTPNRDQTNDISTSISFIKINFPWDIFGFNGEAIRADFQLITAGRVSQPISKTVQTINPEHIFIEEGASVECSTLNASGGPIYIGKDAEIMEGCNVRGPLAMCHNSVLKMQAVIYPDCTFGPFCKVGGEISNAVFWGYSSKPHGGFMGNSVIGEWCNVAAGADTSNLNNTYQNIRVWNYTQKRFIDTHKQFCGLIMGDHSKCGIGTQFNTGTVIGVNCNIYGAGYHRNYVHSFAWGSNNSGYLAYNFKKAIEVATAVMLRRKIELSEVDIQILKHIHDISRIA